jgi:hypothetical protein
VSDPNLDAVLSAMTSRRGDLRLSQDSYEVAKELERQDPPISALIAAAMRKADPGNLGLLLEAFPQVWIDLYERLDTPGARPGTPQL